MTERKIKASGAESGDIFISSDKALLDPDVIWDFIANHSYWGNGRTRSEMADAIRNSALCFGLYHRDGGATQQIGFARLAGDSVFNGFLCDVFVLELWRGRGLGKQLLHTILRHPDVAKLRKLMLFTDTPAFYAPEGFTLYDQGQPGKFMVHRPG